MHLNGSLTCIGFPVHTDTGKVSTEASVSIETQPCEWLCSL